VPHKNTLGKNQAERIFLNKKIGNGSLYTKNKGNSLE
jgi:hypothetical protein